MLYPLLITGIEREESASSSLKDMIILLCHAAAWAALSKSSRRLRSTHADTTLP
jgi:hypothetical protein